MAKKRLLKKKEAAKIETRKTEPIRVETKKPSLQRLKPEKPNQSGSKPEKPSLQKSPLLTRKKASTLSVSIAISMS